MITRLMEILENIYYNPVCHLACRIFFCEKNISGVDLLEMTLKGAVFSFGPFSVSARYAFAIVSVSADIP